MKLKPETLLLYAITDRNCIGKRDFLTSVEDSLRGGATILQLREKGLEEKAFIEEAKQVSVLCRKYKVPLIINDNYRVALESGADGVHVGAEDTAVSEIRSLAGENFIIGATAKTAEQARTAQESGADYLGVGAVFPSPTKKNAVRITQEQFQEIKRSVTIPCVAIGGITRENIITLGNLNADGFALISAVFAQNSIENATKNLKAVIQKMKAENNSERSSP